MKKTSKALGIILISISLAVLLLYFFPRIESEEEAEVVDKIINQYPLEVQLNINRLRIEFMKNSNGEEDLTAIEAKMDSILSSNACQQKTRWLRIRRDDGKFSFTEKLIHDEGEAPLNFVYKKIRRMKK